MVHSTLHCQFFLVNIAFFNLNEFPGFILLYLISSVLDMFAKLQKVTISFVISVSLFVRPSLWNNSAPTRQIFMKF